MPEEQTLPEAVQALKDAVDSQNDSEIAEAGENLVAVLRQVEQSPEEVYAEPQEPTDPESPPI